MWSEMDPFSLFFRGSWENLRVVLRTHYYSSLIHLCSLSALIPSLLPFS